MQFNIPQKQSNQNKIEQVHSLTSSASEHSNNAEVENLKKESKLKIKPSIPVTHKEELDKAKYTIQTLHKLESDIKKGFSDLAHLLNE